MPTAAITLCLSVYTFIQIFVLTVMASSVKNEIIDYYQ